MATSVAEFAGPLRVAFLVRNVGLNGSFWITDDLIRAFAEAGHDVMVLHYDQRRAGRPKHLVELLGSERVWSSPAADRRRNPVQFLHAHCSMLIRFGMHLIRNRYDVVIGHTFLSSMTPLGPLARIVAGSRYAGIIWDFYPIQWEESGWNRSRAWLRISRFTEAFEFRHIDMALVPTNDNARFLQDYHRKSRAAPIVTGIWRDARNFPDPAEARRELGDHDVTEVVVFGGTMQQGRDFEGVLRAAKILSVSRPGARLMFVGGGTTVGMLSRTSRAMGLTNVDIAERVPFVEYTRMLARCDVGLVLTSNEVSVPSFPSKTLDYMASELPVIACVREGSDFGDMIAREWGCGLAASPDDPIAIASAICEALDDRRRGNRMGQEGRAAFLSRLQPQTVVDQLETAVRS